MARPTKKLRLADLDITMVAAEIEREATQRLQSIATILGFGIHRCSGGSGIFYPVIALARYAETGERPRAFAGEIPGVPAETLITVFGDEGLPDVARLLIDAARARYRIETGIPVSAKELGLLVGLDERHVRLLARRGELRLDGSVEPDEAGRWLRARGVPGFEARQVSRSR